ncbi:hypothetical protein J6590_103135 [Homalodisca vitripennis]|nr:hypothetical protein J6590_103135 [Homalodisca vitripennis]
MPIITSAFSSTIARTSGNFTKIDSGQVEGTKVMLDSLDRKEKEQNRASLKRIIDTTIFCGENELPLQGRWATDGRKPFRKGGRFSSVARVQIKLTTPCPLLRYATGGIVTKTSERDITREHWLVRETNSRKATNVKVFSEKKTTREK